MSERTRIVIVGGVAGGASAAARARRVSEDAEIIMFERGEHISFANCGLPYYLGGVITDRDRLLVQTCDGMRNRYRIDVRINSEVIKIDREKKEVVVLDKKTGNEYSERYDKLILSPGADPIKPRLPGVDSRLVKTLRNMKDCDDIEQLIEENKPSRAVIVGGGYIGLEMAEALVHRGIKVTLVELMDQVMGPVDPEMATPIHQHLQLKGIDLRLGTSVDGFNEDNNRLRVHLSTGETLECGLAILSVGVRPEVKLAKDAGLELGERGGIKVDDHLRTSDPDIFAIGDAIEVLDFVGKFPTLVPLAGPANRQGRIAADNALGRDSIYPGTQGTGICKIFELAIGITGLSEKLLRKIGRKYEKIYVHPASHASYYPGAHPVSLKLIFDPDDGTILGAQAAGMDGVDKRIDLLAMAIRGGLTVFDLQNMELCYAPPFGSSKDPVNYAGFVASNVIRGDMHICHVEDIMNPREDQVILDIRNPSELEAGAIPGNINIPIDQLRDRLTELDKSKEYLVYCRVGLRGYLACRILEQNGFKCRNLTGGYKTYQDVLGIKPKEQVETKEITVDTGELDVATRARKRAGKELPEIVVDAIGLQCPGPIMKLKEAIDKAQLGQTIRIRTTDSAFLTDIESWCNSTGNELVESRCENGICQAVILNTQAEKAAGQLISGISNRKKTIIVFSDDLDRVMASFIIANGAAAMGSEVTMFFTFWGINALRKSNPPVTQKTFMEKMFGWMMPQGADKLPLSKMNMIGLGTMMMKGAMKQKNVPSLPELIEQAKRSGVKLVVCSMSLDVMGIKKEELIDGVEEGSVARYLASAEQGNVNLFI